jgi:hypothetical protein
VPRIPNFPQDLLAPISQRRSVTPAAIAGLILRLLRLSGGHYRLPRPGEDGGRYRTLPTQLAYADIYGKDSALNMSAKLFFFETSGKIGKLKISSIDLTSEA